MLLKSKEQIRFIINLIFAVYNCVLGIVSGSIWFLTVGAYYVILSVMRISVIAFSKKAEESDLFIMKFTGGMLLALSVILGFTVYLSVGQMGATVHHEIVMITIALYAFTKLTLAIMGFIKEGKKNSARLKTLTSITVTDAVVSIYSLQRSMLVTFEGMTVDDIALFNALSGAGMCIIVIFIGLNLIMKKESKEMAKSKITEGLEKIEKGVVEGYKKIEDGVVEGYKKIEKGVVEGYTKIEDKFVDQYLTRDGESVKDAKARLRGKKDDN